MTLTELIDQLEEIKDYCFQTDVHTDDVRVFIRGIDGVKREASDLYSLVATKRMIVLDNEA